MTCEGYTERLGDYVDGTLDAADMGAVSAHLETCDSCRALASDFSRLRVAARSLEPALPPAHVWTRISAAVEAQQHRSGLRLPERLDGVPWWRLPERLDGVAWWRLPERLDGVAWWRRLRPIQWSPILAGAAVVVLLCGGAWIAWREVANAGRSRQSTTAASAKAVETFESELSLAEEHYSKAIASLEQITKSDANALDGQTAQVLQTNLAIIDTAIGQSRDALKAAPASEVAQQSLFDALRSKVALLQDTVALINEMRKGNQAGAARIVSGMNQ